MHLVPCRPPLGPIEAAPLTPLCAPTHGAIAASPVVEHAAFWGMDDCYYVRRTEQGRVSWFVGRAAGAPAVDETRPTHDSGAPSTGAPPADDIRPARPVGRTSALRWVLVGRHRRSRARQSAVRVCVRRRTPVSATRAVRPTT